MNSKQTAASVTHASSDGGTYPEIRNREENDKEYFSFVVQRYPRHEDVPQQFEDSETSVDSPANNTKLQLRMQLGDEKPPREPKR
jgi:hypothetical protein